MSDEPKSSAEKTVSMVTDLAKAVPIYPDLVQPGAKELGQSVGEAAGLMRRTVHHALTPLRAAVWGADKLEDFFTRILPEKLKGVPPEQIQTPPLYVAGPAVQALMFAGEEESLRELFANLLASSMDSATAAIVHPAFVEVIKNMSPDEARILRLFDAKCEPLDAKTGLIQLANRADCIYPDMAYTYVENLQRLRIISSDVEEQFFQMKEDLESIDTARRLNSLAAFDGINDDEFSRDYSGNPLRFADVAECLRLTEFGTQFVRACVLPKESVNPPA